MVPMTSVPVPIAPAPQLTLPDTFQMPAGYHAPCWIERTTATAVVPDREIPAPLRRFLNAIGFMAYEHSINHRHGTAYMRVMPASASRGMQWHVDNDDGAVRFTAAASSDDHPVGMAWLQDPELIGVDSSYAHPHTQTPNGHIAMFRQEPHGVIPRDDDTDAVTVVYFATLWESRDDADLYTSHTVRDELRHPALPSLEGTRGSAA